MVAIHCIAVNAMDIAARITEPFSAVLMAADIAIPAVATPCSIWIVAFPLSPIRSPRTSQLSMASLIKSNVPSVALARLLQSLFISADVFFDPDSDFLNTPLKALPRALNGFTSRIFFFASSNLSRTAFKSAGLSFKSAVFIFSWISEINLSICSTVRASRSVNKFFQLSVCINIWAFRAERASASPLFISAKRVALFWAIAEFLNRAYSSWIDFFCSSNVLKSLRSLSCSSLLASSSSLETKRFASACSSAPTSPVLPLDRRSFASAIACIFSASVAALPIAWVTLSLNESIAVLAPRISSYCTLRAIRWLLSPSVREPDDFFWFRSWICFSM